MLLVADLMTLDPDAVSPETNLGEVVRRMRVDGCRQLPVVEAGERLVGIVIDRDVRLAMHSPLILHEVSQDEVLLRSATAGSVMTLDPISVSPETPAYRAAEMLIAYKIGALPVVDGGRLVGILSVTDVLERFVEEHQAVEAEAELAH